MYAAVASRYFRQCGWDVFLADSGPQARRLARELNPLVVALAVELREQSGWLTCWKLLREQPRLKVLLVSSQPAPDRHRFAAFVGAAGLVDRKQGVAGLVDAVYGAALRAVG
jgi:DNA-binding response OmpR family regulator